MYGGDEVRVHGQRLLVVLDRLLEASRLHEQLGVRVVGVGIARDQLDVLLEGLLRLRVLAHEAIGVAHLVVGLRELRVEGRGLLVFDDRGRVVLLAESDCAIWLCARSSSGTAAMSLVRQSFWRAGSPLPPASIAQIRRRSGSEALADSSTALPVAAKNSLAVPAVLARPSWASAKLGSLASACSNSGRASVARSFSTRSRPFR
jgi:hypothetical protein